MKTPSEENHDLIRWLDDEMTVGERREFEANWQSDPELAAEAESMRWLSERLKAHLPAEIPVPHADFFNSQIQARIAQMEVDDARERAETAASTTSRFLWLRLPWLAGAAAAALAIVGLVWTQSGSSGCSTILSTYTPNPSMKALVIEHVDAVATVLLLEGLDPIPAEKKVVGFHVHHAESDAEVATTTLFDENGAVLAVVALNAQGQPQMLK
jgi:hypothetical protein